MSKNSLDNGTGRKQLADQLDRLDGILDGLAESFNAAIATTVEKAVSGAVKEAVEGVLVEVLTNPVFQQLQKATAPEPTAAPEKQSSPSRLSSVWNWVCNKVRSTAGACTSAVCKVGRGVRLAWQATGRAVRGLVLAGVGVVAGVAYATRSSLGSAVATVVGLGRRLITRAGNALALLLPAFSFGT
jgi:hypothetical protein